MTDKELIELALKARENSYSPYSGFAVGAALIGKNGKVYTGCNIENSAFSSTCCAERVAFFKGISEGTTEFDRLVVAGGRADSEPEDYCAPCGVCRQVISEFCDENFVIILAKSKDDYIIRRLSELLPHSFGKANIK